MPEYPTLYDAAAAWLAVGMKPAEQHAAEHGNNLGDVSVKFTWRGHDYEVSVRKLGR